MPVFLPAPKIQCLKLRNEECHQLWKKKTMLAAPEALKVGHFNWMMFQMEHGSFVLSAM